MKREFTEESEKIMTWAQDEARRLNHDYVGTEHILLALLIERPGALDALGVSADVIRQEIAEQVMPGRTTPASAQIPLTPRAKSVIEFARLEAFSIGQTQIEPEHLLVGLIHEPDGVAQRVLRSLGLDLRQVQRESLKFQLEKMRIVERAVRPLRAGAARKRKMREELLAHLSEIFEEERSRLNDSAAALAEAEKRFGDPAQLSRELQGALKSEDRRNYFFEYWLGWRPPETAVRMVLRASLVTALSMLCLIVIPMGIEMIIVRGASHLDPVGLRAIAAMVFFTPLAQFLISICYYKIRDSLFGVFGSRKSLANGILRAALASLCAMLCSVAAITMMNASFQPVAEFTVPLVAVSIFGGIICLILAKVRGPVEIRDTIWATMDLAAS